MNFSDLLEGFIRVLYACWHGGGKGLLAVPDNEYNQLLEQREFLAEIAMASRRTIGLYNAEMRKTEWLT